MHVTTDEVVMIRPAAFGYNAQTAVNNAYQNIDCTDSDTIQSKALAEFDDYVAALQSHGIKVHVLQDTSHPHTPDSIFPNNWFSTHSLADGGSRLVLYPMFAANRQLESRKFEPSLRQILTNGGEAPATQDRACQILDLRGNEAHQRILEGTGSMVIDHKSGHAYVSLSQRSNPALLQDCCQRLGLKPVAFTAIHEGQPVYHTNVMMSSGSQSTLICLDIIAAADRSRVVRTLIDSGNRIITLRPEQISHFLGNTLELRNQEGQSIRVMSRSAYQSLDEVQEKALRQESELLIVDIPTIEFYGGGSARCMLGEIFR